MKLRKNILPKRLVDLFCFLLIGVFLPIVFIFEMVIVLPEFHEAGGFFHTFTLIMALFLLFNITGNMLACMLIDTSVDFKNIKPLNNEQEKQWRYCEHCKGMAPPRSWHCEVCGVCILKRDHHCLFTACCIGHRNHRYFMMFVVFLFIGATYAFVYNSLYLFVLKARFYRNWLSYLKMACPLIMVATGSAWHNIYLLFYNLNILAMGYSVLLLLYHGPIVWKGGVCFERNKQYSYDQGWRKNLQGILGKRMHLAWLSPLIKSELPDDGIRWSAVSKKSK